MKTIGLLAALMMMSAEASTPLDPPAAITAAAHGSAAGVEGDFMLTVASANRSANATYLNSEVDYRAATNLSFVIAPAAAKTLAKRLGGQPEQMLVGKTVVAHGIVRASRVYSNLGGRPHTLLRTAYSVTIKQAAQIGAIR